MTQKTMDDYTADEIVTFTKRKKRCICGKTCFDKKTAQTKKNQLEKIGIEKYLRIYECELCNWWHLTKTRRHDRKNTT